MQIDSSVHLPFMFTRAYRWLLVKRYLHRSWQILAKDLRQSALPLPETADVKYFPGGTQLLAESSPETGSSCRTFYSEATGGYGDQRSSAAQRLVRQLKGKAL